MSKPAGDASSREMFLGISRGVSPPKRGSHQLLAAYRDIPALQQVVGRIAESFASIQFTVHRAVDPKGKSILLPQLARMTASHRATTVKKMVKNGDLEEIHDDPLLDFIDSGNDHHTGFEARELMQKHLELMGEAYAWKERNAFGMPVRLWPLAPTWVRDIPGPGDGTYTVSIGNRTEVKIRSSEILSIKLSDPSKPYGRGSGIAESLGHELDADEYAAKFIASFFYNDATPSGIVAFDDVKGSQLKELEQRWMEKHRGAQKSHTVHFTSPKPQVTMFDASFKDMSIVDLRKFLRSLIRETWGIPPEIVGVIENSNRATIDAAETIFARWLLTPRADRWARALQKQVAPDFDERKIVGYVSPIPEDKAHALEVSKAASWSLTRGEWREMQGLERHGDADDVYVQPLNLVERPIDGADESASPIAPPADNGDPPESLSAGVNGVVTKAAIEVLDIDRILQKVNADRIGEEIDEFYEDELREAGQQTLDDLNLAMSFNLLNPDVVTHLGSVKSRIVDINDTTRTDLSDALIDGIREGEGAKDLAKRVSFAFDKAKGFRSILIARTEVARSANFAVWNAYKQSGAVTRRKWITTLDGRQRDMHGEVHGQEVGIDEMFVLPDGARTMYPGETGDPKHDANERCTTIAVIEDIEDSADRSFIELLLSSKAHTRDEAEAWRAFDRRILPWERQTELAYGRAFTAQEQEALAELEAISTRRGTSDT